MKISLAIMAHPKRVNQAHGLALELGQYPFCDIDIIWDQVNVEWETGKRALQFGIGKGDFHVVIQDDALLTPHFYENLENAINGLPSQTLFSLYTGTSRPIPKRVTAAVNKAQNGEWLRHHQLFWGVGIVIPTSHIEPMLEFVEDVELQYDNKIGEFYCQNGLPVYYCIPSLVDHDDELGTLIDGHGKHINDDPRVAHRLATAVVSWSNKTHYI